MKLVTESCEFGHTAIEKPNVNSKKLATSAASSKRYLGVQHSDGKNGFWLQPALSASGLFEKQVL